MKLAAKNLAYGYPGRQIGSDVTLELGAGEVLCLLGPNGSGKTTFFKTLLGLLPIQDGSVMLNGRDLQQLERDEIPRLVSYVPQAPWRVFPVHRARSRADGANLEVIENEPVQIGGRTGFRVRLRFVTPRGIPFEQVLYGVCDEKNYLLGLQAPGFYYFDAHRREFERMVVSFRFAPA